MIVVRMTVASTAVADGCDFGVSAIRLISENPQFAVPVPEIFDGPGEYMGCYQGHTLSMHLIYS